MMKPFRVLVFLVVFALAFGLARRVLATPDAPRAAINPSALQCMPMVYWRDECRELLLPAGWEYADQAECPVGYTEVPDFKLDVLAYQNDFCCRQRGGEFCPGEQASPSPLVLETATPAEAEPVPSSDVLPVAGGLSLLAGLGLGVYRLLTRRKA
jgi:hypothetical protein